MTAEGWLNKFSVCQIEAPVEFWAAFRPPEHRYGLRNY